MGGSSPILRRDLVVVGGSAGSLLPMRQLLERLDEGFQGSLFLATHLAPGGTSLLASILAKATELEVREARDGEPLVPRRVYVAPKDRHLLLGPEGVVLGLGPRENGFRPAIDPLFRTAAVVFGPRVVGVLLSGGLDDGVHGLQRIHEAGGVTVVQDPEEAEQPSMPMSALRNVAVQHVVRAPQLAELVLRLAREEVQPMTNDKELGREPDIAEIGDRGLSDPAPVGRQINLTCPECGGVLRQLDGAPPRVRCHTGHTLTLAALRERQDEAVENALWTALRALEEKVEVRRRMLDGARERGLDALIGGFQEELDDARARADSLRGLLIDMAPAGHVRGVAEG